MVIIPFIGGLGNQMFQYAFSLKLGQSNSIYYSTYFIKKDKGHNGFELEHLFGLRLKTNFPLEILVRFIRKLVIFKIKNNLFAHFTLQVMSYFGIHVIEEKYNYIYSNCYLKKFEGLNILYGYWQTEKYFEDIKGQILLTFNFNLSLLSERNKDLLQKINRTNAVSIHVRRGDYLSKENKEIYGNICTEDYYKKAITIMDELDSPSYYIFSDDPVWVKKNLLLSNAIYVDWNKGRDSWQDLLLMSKCKHNIIANSSFSWWAAWLNTNQAKKVIAPSRFSNIDNSLDVIPETWYKV